MPRRIALALAALTTLHLAACSGAEETEPDQGEVAGALRQYTSDPAGFDTHSFYYDTGREVVVFDAQFTEAHASELVADIKASTSSPIRYVVVTHPSPDKFNGVGVLRAEGAQVVASEATAAAIAGVHEYKKAFWVSTGAFTEETYPPLATVDITFSTDLALPLEGDARVHLETLEHSGVVTTQTVAHIPVIGALITGDLVHHKAHAWLEGGIQGGKPSPDLASWKLALDELSAFSGATVHGGRGEPAPVELAVADQKAYLTGMEKIVTDYVKSAADPADLTGPNAPAHHVAITDLAVAAFPEHKLPYMITYGVYGLLQEIAATP